LKALDDVPLESDNEPLLPTPPVSDAGPVSAATLLLKAKQFDDGLHAAVELAAQQGAGRFPGKMTWLQSLAAAADHPAAAATIHGAGHRGGLRMAAPESLQEAVRTAVTEFLGNPLLAKPLGFYTWSEPLRAVFRQDRFLQQPLHADTADALTRALKRTPGASA